VNSEEGYQNLTRFLFGDVRVDGVLEISDLSLPPEIEQARADGKKVRASYHFEVVTTVRGAHWDLSRRLVEENSAIFRTYNELFAKDPTEARHPTLFSTFLNARARIVETRPSLGFSVDLRVLVPEYEVDGALWLEHHYPGGYLFRDKINLEAIPPIDQNTKWALNYGFDSLSPNRTTTAAQVSAVPGRLEFQIPINQFTAPGISAVLKLIATAWNT
jgi:hypothetical protein